MMIIINSKFTVQIEKDNKTVEFSYKKVNQISIKCKRAEIRLVTQDNLHNRVCSFGIFNYSGHMTTLRGKIVIFLVGTMASYTI